MVGGEFGPTYTIGDAVVETGYFVIPTQAKNVRITCEYGVGDLEWI